VLNKLSPKPAHDPSDVNTAKISALSVLNIPKSIKASYSKLVLISHPQHISNLDLKDDDVLIVSTDWLVWREIVEQGGHCLHLESMLGNYEGTTDFFIRCSNWVYVDEKDVTNFEGMSLGKAFNREIELALLSFEKAWISINAFCEVYNIKKIILYDLRGDYGLIDSATKRLIVESISESHGIDTDIQLDEPPDGDPAFSDLAHYGVVQKEGIIRPLLRHLYSFAIDFIFQFKWYVNGRRERVFLLLNLLMEESLVRFTPTAGPAPILSAERSPKSWAFIRDCWQNGGYLGRIKPLALTRTEKLQVSRIIDNLKSAWASEKAGSSFETARRRYITKRIFESERLYDFAKQAKSYQAFFQRKKIKSIIVGDATSAPCRLAIEAAHTLGISSDESLNGTFVYDLKYDVRCGDGRQPAKLSRLFAWGPQQEEWLKCIHSPISCVRTGYPGLDSISSQEASYKLPKPSGANVLVLPCYITSSNIRGLKSNTLTLLVDVIQTLTQLGYSNIRVKIHPGRGGMKYLQRLVKMYNLNCELFEKGSIPDHMDWADFIIGPVDSGSIVETLAAGKPYLGFDSLPTCVVRRLWGPFPVLETAEDLRDALNNGNIANRQQSLEHLTNSANLQPASPNIWRALADS
jgi:hypothetical protein